MKQPNSRANLDKAIQRIADGDRDTYIGIRAVIANTVVGQMLPDGAVKGGSSIKLRLGDAGTRFTTDLEEMLAASEVTPLSECIPMSDGAAQVRESMPKR